MEAVLFLLNEITVSWREKWSKNGLEDIRSNRSLLLGRLCHDEVSWRLMEGGVVRISSRRILEWSSGQAINMITKDYPDLALGADLTANCHSIDIEVCLLWCFSSLRIRAFSRAKLPCFLSSVLLSNPVGFSLKRHRSDGGELLTCSLDGSIFEEDVVELWWLSWIR